MLLIIGGVGAIPGTAEETAKLFPAVYLVTVAGPSLAGILLTGLTGGWAGLRELLSRLLKWRVGAPWYAVALLTAPLTVMGTLLALSIVSAEFVPGFLTTSIKASLLQFGIVAGLGLGTGLLVGLLWGAWHFLSNVWASGTSSGAPSSSSCPRSSSPSCPPTGC